MNKTRDVLLGTWLMFVGFVLFVLAPLLAIPKGRLVRTTVVKVQVGENAPQEFGVDRYEWGIPDAGTPDELMPGGLYEQAILRTYLAWSSRWWTATNWLWRNSGYGVAWHYGSPTYGYLDLKTDGFVDRAPSWYSSKRYLWRWQKTFGPVKFMAGWKVHRRDYLATATEGPYLAIPFVSVRRASSD